MVSMERHVIWDEVKGMVLVSKKGEVKVNFGRTYYDHKIWLDKKAALYDLEKAKTELKNSENRLKANEAERQNLETQIKDYNELIKSYERIKGKLIDKETDEKPTDDSKDGM